MFVRADVVDTQGGATTEMTFFGKLTQRVNDGLGITTAQEALTDMGKQMDDTAEQMEYALKAQLVMSAIMVVGSAINIGLLSAILYTLRSR